jgi:hypothetical protein
LIVILADLSMAGGESAHECALERKLLRALDHYCSTAAAPSEQRSCRIVHSRLDACTAFASEGDDGAFMELHDERITDGYCLHLSFSHARDGGYRLDSFSKGKSPCDCDCCP